MFSVKVAKPVPLKAPSVDAILLGLGVEPEFGLLVVLFPEEVLEVLPEEVVVGEELVLHE